MHRHEQAAQRPHRPMACATWAPGTPAVGLTSALELLPTSQGPGARSQPGIGPCAPVRPSRLSGVPVPALAPRRTCSRSDVVTRDAVPWTRPAPACVGSGCRGVWRCPASSWWCLSVVCPAPSFLSSRSVLLPDGQGLLAQGPSTQRLCG